MATSISLPAIPPRPRRPFAASHRADRNLFLTYVMLIWLAVLAGFIPDMVRHIRTATVAYPIAVHVHAAASVAWLSLLTSQTLLVRNHRLVTHRKMGIIGVILAIVVLVVSFWAALAVEAQAWGTPKSRPPFLAIELSNMIEFGGLAAAAFIARRQPSAHKRLILLATLSLTPAAFNRLIGRSVLHPLIGNGVWQTYVQIFAATDLLVLGIGLYDWVTRRRLHPAWIFGALLILAGQISASWLYYDARWKAFATAIVQTLR